MIYLKINFLRNINLNNIRHKKFNKKFFNNKFNLEYHSFFEKDIKNSSQIVIIFVNKNYLKRNRRKKLII